MTQIQFETVPDVINVAMRILSEIKIPNINNHSEYIDAVFDTTLPSVKIIYNFLYLYLVLLFTIRKSTWRAF